MLVDQIRNALSYVSLTKKVNWWRHLLFFVNISKDCFLVCFLYALVTSLSLWHPQLLLSLRKRYSWYKFQLHTMSRTWDDRMGVHYLRHTYEKSKFETDIVLVGVFYWIGSFTFLVPFFMFFSTIPNLRIWIWGFQISVGYASLVPDSIINPW